MTTSYRKMFPYMGNMPVFLPFKKKLPKKAPAVYDVRANKDFAYMEWHSGYNTSTLIRLLYH